MHEYSIVSALMDRIEQEAVRRGARRVRAVKVSIGEIAGVEVELFRTAYQLVSDSTLCAGAALDVEVVPVRWACPRCAAPPEPGARLICPLCGGAVRLVSGDEIMLDRLELEVA
jgi:hydrogenase nickel incorporation protein HypA/HybF